MVVFKNKKAVGLISGGIDSAVSVYLMSKKMDIVLVHFDNRPFVGEVVKKKVLRLRKRLEEVCKKKFKLLIVPFGGVLKEIVKFGKKNVCVLCRRMMYRIGNRIADKEGADFLLDGSSLNQVASQTLQNMIVESEVSEREILHPLLGFNKEEIVEIAKKIGTYEISILREKACLTNKGRMFCCFATPRYPQTRAVLKEIKEIEKKFIDKIQFDFSL